MSTDPRTTLTPQEERLALFEKECLDLSRAMDDLMVIVNAEKSKQSLYRRILTSMAKKINGWVEEDPSDDVLRALPIQLDVLMATKQREIEQVQERMESLKNTVNKSIIRRERARRARMARCIGRVKK